MHVLTKDIRTPFTPDPMGKIYWMRLAWAPAFTGMRYHNLSRDP
jgi:hypothetical protein